MSANLYANFGSELGFVKGSRPELDLTFGLVGGFSINHTLMNHRVYKAE